MTVERLLIYRFGHIGDTVAALPALWHLRAQFPNAHITLLSETPKQSNHLPPERVLPQTGLIDAFLKYQGGKSLSGIASQVATLFRLRAMKFDTVAYLLPSIRSAASRRRDEAFFKLTGIPRRLGFQGFPEDALPRRADGSLETVPHEADALLTRLSLDGLPPVAAGHGRMDLAITPSEHHAAGDWLKTNAMGSQRWFALCNGSKWSSKQWPEERYLEVARRLITQHDLTPVVFGGREDVESGRRLIAQLGRGACSAGELSVRESAAMLQCARFYLGNDTGVMHLAAAVGTRCVAVFSAQDWPGRWSPYGAGHEMLRVEVPCAGCMQQNCPLENQCLTGISPEAVLAACGRILATETRGLT